jgi:predicted O-linked N-acetylglucosamine transferase (SPINDLY family)
VSTNPADIRKKAWQAHADGDLKSAEELYRWLLQAHTEADEAVNLGALLRQDKRLVEASEHYHHWLAVFPEHHGLALNAVNCWLELGAHASARVLLERLLEQQPEDLELRQALANTWLAAGDPGRARALLEPLVHQEAGKREAWINLGVCYARLGQLSEALRAFDQAQRLDPNDARMGANRITILKDLGRLEEAEQLWGNLPDSHQQHPDVRGALAGLWMAMNRLEEASQLLAPLAAEQPDNPVHWLNWAACLRGLKYTVAPHQILLRGLLWHPRHTELQQALGQSLAEMSRLEGTTRLWSLWPGNSAVQKDVHLFSQQFLGASYGLSSVISRATQARQWEEQQKRQGYGRLWPDLLLEPLEGRKLRVGYLSADFCNHPVGRFMLPLLQNHDRSVVEVWALSCGPYDDWITDHLRQAVDHWLDLRFLNDLQAARLMADQRFDVVVELGGFTGHSRVALLAQRPAPVQLSYLGYPAPTYLREIDGWIGDEALFGGLEPVDREAHRLLKVEGGYMAFDPGGELPMPERCESPRFRFGCFNHARKLTDRTVALFCRVMAAGPEADLVLKSISFHEPAEQERVRKRFENAGLPTDRLQLLPWVEGGLNHLLRYSEMDVALDPVPYGGATTTCEALWMGVPVVAVAGAGMVGRLAASLLVHGQQCQWLAANEDEYVEIARKLAAEGPRDRSRREELRRRLESSHLADGKRLASALETVYRQLRGELRGL